MSLNLFQVIDKQSRTNIGTVANERMDNLTTLLEDKLKSPLTIGLSGAIISIASSTQQKSESDGFDSTQDSYKWRIPSISNLSVVTLDSSINVSSGVTTGSFKNNPEIGVIIPTSYYIQMGVELRNDGYLYVVWGNSAATLGGTTFPGFSKGNALPILVISLRNNGVSGSWNYLTPSKSNIEIFKGGNAGGSGEVTPGSNLGSINYRIEWNDSFADNDLINLTAGKTTAIRDSAKERMAILYHASLAGISGGNLVSNITWSGVPSFTVAVGDVICALLSGNLEVRKITAISSQTPSAGQCTIEAAFSASLATASKWWISQCVNTVDMLNWYDSSNVESRPAIEGIGHIKLANVGNVPSDTVDFSEIPTWLTPATGDIVIKNGIETTVSSTVDSDTFVLTNTTGFGGDGDGWIIRPVSEITLNWFDSGYVNDIHVAAQIITGSDSGSNWAAEYGFYREQNYQDVIFPQEINGTPGAHAYARFFANVSSELSNYGTVYLYNYYAWMIPEEQFLNGGIKLQAYGLTNGTLTRNCTISTVSSKTRINFTDDFPAFIYNVNSGLPSGELKVFVNGQRIPRKAYDKFGALITLGKWYIEGSNGQYIELDKDYSAYAYEIFIEAQYGLENYSDQITNRINAFYPIVLGDSNDIVLGTATHSTWATAISDSLDGGRIFVLPRTWTETVTISKSLLIEGSGHSSQITGNLIFNSSSDYSTFKWIRVNGNITFNSGANGIFCREIWTTGTVSDSGLANSKLIIAE